MGKMLKMRGVAITGKKQLEIKNDCPLPEEIVPTGAIVRPDIWSVCTSDAHLYEIGCASHPYLVGKAAGHEMCGTITKVGPEVKDFEVGDRVVVCTKMPNWRSIEAQQGYYRANVDNMFWGIDWPDRGGSFVEQYYIRDADMNLAKIPEGVSFEQAVMIPDMMGTGFQGAEELDIELGDSVAVFGIGPVGLMALRGAVLKGAGKVFAIGSRQVCFDVAKEYGATYCIDYHDENYIEKILELNGGPVGGVIMAGGKSSEINKGLRVLRRGGTLVSLAAYLDEQQLHLDMAPWNYGTGGKTIKAISCAGGRWFLTRMLNLIELGRVKPEKMITHRFYGLDSIPEAMELYTNLDRSLIKAVIYND